MQKNSEKTRFRDALECDLDEARVMIEEGFDINIPLDIYGTPLQFVTQHGNLRAVEFLLQHGVQLTQETDWRSSLPIIHAVTIGNYDILKLLLTRGADANERRSLYGITPLLVALTSKNLKWTKLLLEHGADITATCESGMTALHYAAHNSRLEVIQFLLEQGLDIDGSDYSGRSALHVAVTNNNPGTCEYLLRRGASVNKMTITGKTPLIMAVRDACLVAIVELLLKYGANVCCKAQDGSSALELAARGNNKTNAKLLIQQLARMQYLNSVINECDQRIIENDNYLKIYHGQCLQELQSMEATKFYNSISVLDIFIKRESLIFKYAGNEELVGALERGPYKQYFPIYFACLKKNFHVNVEKQRFRRAAAIMLCNIFNFNDPVHVVNQKILGYMSDEDLKLLQL